MLAVLALTVVTLPAQVGLLPTAGAAANCPRKPCFRGDGNQFVGGIQATAGAGTALESRASGKRASTASRQPAVQYEVRYVPVCSGNGISAEDTLCSAALEFARCRTRSSSGCTAVP